MATTLTMVGVVVFLLPCACAAGVAQPSRRAAARGVEACAKSRSGAALPACFRRPRPCLDGRRRLASRERDFKI